MSELRFSPRPNRAAEIEWMSWGADAFERAASEDKPILLSISAVWCHWCHVMDETSYSDQSVIETINRHFVPVRVDNDKRPDVNARYNMGGWPTTAFLTPDGTKLTGATYLPPAQMRRALEEIARFYSERKEEIAARTPDVRARTESLHRPGSEELDDAPVAELIDQLEGSYDLDFGGFGDAPKFPQPEVHEFLLAQWRHSGDNRLHEMAAKTMLAMSRGGMYDHVEGGFFRYSTTRDWSVPHFEKMAEDHAGLLRVLALWVLFSPTTEFRETLVSASGYVRGVLRDPQSGFFAGSQDADEAYYELPLEARRAREAPFVDRTSYTNWTCALAGSQCLVARALDDENQLREALATLDRVADRLIGEGGLLYHVLVPDGVPEVRGLLVDQAAYARALLDAHEICGETRFLERAVSICDATIANLASTGGGFYDRLSEDAFGRLALADRPITENGSFADTLLRLSSLTGDERYRARAREVLQIFAQSARGAGLFSASYARALQRYLAPEVSVRIVGDASSTTEFRKAAFHLRTPFVAIRSLSSSAAEKLDMPGDTPAAYVCVTGACGAPVRNAADLPAAFEALVNSSGGATATSARTSASTSSPKFPR
ncbi:MAG: thioredoxin domain-containing protein [Candidatus Eremiobacteraeota bacterium]|nr:thioredoxin domain-containing protein [Candidatus Eremiobacteraeota bacterium]